MTDKIGDLGNIPNLPHTDKKMNCDLCTFETKSIENLNSHKRDVHVRASIPCNSCNFKASNIEQLRSHEKTHEKQAQFKCDQCPLTADTKYVLEAHKQNEHKNLYTCEQCKFEDKREECPQSHYCTTFYLHL